ncbi:MAG: hypothetical protein IJZ90_00150 [Clostridia bacterium]|nr:hypothetical protein [Clostridia bacterium]
MENQNDKETFSYTYSAKEQEEIKNIRKKYIQPEEDKMAQLRRLDASVYKKASTVSLVVGIIGAIIMGLGMSLVMTDIRETLSLHGNVGIIIGIIIGIIGIAAVCVAYPLYNRILKKEREKAAPEIIRLSDELMKY